MIKIEHILCHVDLSESSDKSLRYAAALARASLLVTDALHHLLVETRLAPVYEHRIYTQQG